MPENNIKEQIKLSVITVNLNNACGLKETAQSISRLTYKYHEWLIIDGASNDDSLQVIKGFNHLITRLVSEPDNGIYNAMNKGVRLASGNMLLFMNSGDIFADSDCLDFLNEYEYSPKYILIGKSQFTNSKAIYPTTEDSVYLNKRKYFCNGFIPHQATFIPRQLLLFMPYNEKLKFASDNEFILKMRFRHNIRLTFLNIIISLCDGTGYSNNPVYQKDALREILYIRYKHFGLYYTCYMFQYIFKKLVKKLLYKYKKLVKLLLFFIIKLFIIVENKITNILPVSKIILIIRPDNIGDYVLFRNMLQEITQISQYCQFKFWLVGNKTFADFAEILDKQYIDKFIWIDQTWYNCRFIDLKFKDALHREKINFILNRKKFHSIIYPVFSRCTCYDKLCQTLSAKYKIIMSGDNVNMVNFADIYKHAYNQVIDIDQSPGVFEFFRNREFISKLLNKKIDKIKPTIDITILPESLLSLPENYVVFHMDASGNSKEWPLQNYLKTAEYINQRYKLPVVLLGRNNNDGFLTSEMANNWIINLYNKTTLSESAAILVKANLFIGNDSSLMHIAAAVGVPNIICLCNGQYYGRFVPYPDNIAKNKYYFLFPPIVEHELNDQDFVKQKYADGHYEDITTIEVSRVLEIIDKIWGCHK
jgi:ADP-heptose:LPS heptosyltransferase